MKKLSLRLRSGTLLLIMTGAAFASTGYVSQTSGQISLAPKDNLLIATTIINWDPKASDQMVTNWIAPKGFCRNSTFNISRGNNTSHDVSWSYRTVIHQNTTCQGQWKVELVNTSTGKVLDSAGYFVPAANANS